MGSESLAEFELLVMLAALRLGQDRAYTVTIAEDIRERTRRSVRRANVFTSLRRLEEKGLISSRLGEPHPARGGRPPRLVTAEPKGVAAVRATTGAIRAMVGELGELFSEAGDGEIEFHEASELTPDHIRQVESALQRRVLRDHLRRWASIHCDSGRWTSGDWIIRRLGGGVRA
jgi:DNA-binding PadR family transcriptional regulator